MTNLHVRPQSKIFAVDLKGSQTETDVKTSVPWRIEFGGIPLSSEADKNVILDWNTGMDGNETQNNNKN